MSLIYGYADKSCGTNDEASEASEASGSGAVFKEVIGILWLQ